MKADLDDLRGFVAVAELGSFHMAADMLHLSQPALTRRIQKLEATLGVQLIERDTRQLRLSSVGRDFFFKVKRLLDELDAAFLGMRELADRVSGEVTIGAVPTATYYFLPQVIEDFNTQYPRIRIRILDLSANDVLEAVKRGQAEFGINLLGAQEPDLEFEPLLPDPFLLVCRKDHPLGGLEQVRWEDIAPYRFITVGRMSGNRIIMDAALAGLSVRPRWFYEVQHLTTSLGLVEKGLGVAAVPQIAVPTGQHPVLVVRPLIEPVVTRIMGIIRRRGATLPPAAQQFHQILHRRWTEEQALGSLELRRDIQPC
jgi:DNA-binding transcriptional LysR family regulator